MTADTQRVEDDQARALLEQILDLRRDAALHPDDRRFASAAASELRRLVIGIGGWAVARMARTVTHEQFASLPVEEKRSIIARHLRHPLMQPGAADDLATALIALNGGQVNALLEPSVTGRRRAYPFDAARLELQMLAWLRWRKGRGDQVRGSRETLAAAICRTPAVFDQWNRELTKLFGRDLVRRELDDAERAGRASLKIPPSRPDGAMISVPSALAMQPPEFLSDPHLSVIHTRMASLALPILARRYTAATRGHLAKSSNN